MLANVEGTGTGRLSLPWPNRFAIATIAAIVTPQFTAAIIQ